MCSGLLTTWLRSVFAFRDRLYNQRTQLNLADRLRLRLFEQLQALSLSYASQTRSGETVSTSHRIYHITLALNVVLFHLPRGSTPLDIFGINVFLLSWQLLTIISVMLFSLLSVGISMLLGRYGASFETTKAAGLVYFSLAGIHQWHTVWHSQLRTFERRRFYDASLQLLKLLPNLYQLLHW